MKHTIVVHTSRIEWRLTNLSPAYFNIGTIHKITILNPLKYPDLYSKNDLIEWNHELGETKEILFATKGLILNLSSGKKLNEIAGGIGEALMPFYKLLRFVSKQHSINPSKIVYGLRPLKEEIKRSELKIVNVAMSMYRRNYYLSCISDNHLKNALKLLQQNYSIPIYDELFLDTISDYTTGNYKKTILYSAITMESFLASHYDNYYSKIIIAKKKNLKYRINKLDNKDPIYEYLKKQNNFYILLNEMPVYLFEKSLKKDVALYNKLDKLHKTRNKIVHLGDLVLKKNDNYEYIPITDSGALEALKILIEGLKYFDVDLSDALDFSFIKFKSTS